MSEEPVTISPDDVTSPAGGTEAGSDASVPSDGSTLANNAQPPSPPERREEKPPSPKTVALVGDRVLISAYKCEGTVRYIGDTAFSGGLWAGVELDQPVGKIDGVVQGKRYFFCKAKHGVFVRPSALQVLPSTSSTSPPSIRDEEHLSSSNVDDSGDYSVGKTPPLRNLTRKEVKPSVPPRSTLKASSAATPAPSSAERKQPQIALAFDSPETKASSEVAVQPTERPVSIAKPKTASAPVASLRVSRSVHPRAATTTTTRSNSIAKDSRGAAAVGPVSTTTSAAALDRGKPEARKPVASSSSSAAASSAALRTKPSTSASAAAATATATGVVRKATPAGKRPNAGTTASSTTTAVSSASASSAASHDPVLGVSASQAGASFAEALKSQLESRYSDCTNYRTCLKHVF